MRHLYWEICRNGKTKVHIALTVSLDVDGFAVSEGGGGVVREVGNSLLLSCFTGVDSSASLDAARMPAAPINEIHEF